MAKAGRHPEAEDFLHRALDALPDRNDLRPLLVDALVGAGRYEDARTEIEACRSANIPLPQELIGRAEHKGSTP
jgi:thioredoxin-like negative regulator of GroEL